MALEATLLVGLCGAHGCIRSSSPAGPVPKGPLDPNLENLLPQLVTTSSSNVFTFEGSAAKRLQTPLYIDPQQETQSAVKHWLAVCMENFGKSNIPLHINGLTKVS